MGNLESTYPILISNLIRRKCKYLHAICHWSFSQDMCLFFLSFGWTDPLMVRRLYSEGQCGSRAGMDGSEDTKIEIATEDVAGCVVCYCWQENTYTEITVRRQFIMCLWGATPLPLGETCYLGNGLHSELLRAHCTRRKTASRRELQ